jgi:hypothetical protein
LQTKILQYSNYCNYCAVEVNQHIPDAVEHQSIISLHANLEEVDEVCVEIQGDQNLCDVRVMFDGTVDLITKIPEFERYLSPDAEIVKDKDFEKAIKKLQGRKEELNEAERLSVQGFLPEPTPPASSSARTAVEIARENKKRRLVQDSPYRSVQHVLPTSNIVERLFSRAKMIMTDQRKRMNPDNLDALLFLKYNKCRWGSRTVQAYLTANPVPIPQAVAPVAAAAPVAPAAPLPVPNLPQANLADIVVLDAEEEEFPGD